MLRLSFINDTAEPMTGGYGQSSLTFPIGLSHHELTPVEDGYLVFGPSSAPDAWSTLAPEQLGSHDRAVCYFARNGDGNPIQMEQFYTFVPGE